MADDLARALEPTGFGGELRIPAAAAEAARAAAESGEAPAPPVPAKQDSSDAARRFAGEKEDDDDNPWLKRVLVVGDETLCFSGGLQNHNFDYEFTAVSALSKQNIEDYGFEPMPAPLNGRIHHQVDLTKLANAVPAQFDGAVLFLPGLAFTIPRELGDGDRALFAFRIHLWAFYMLRQVKQAFKRDQGHIHLVWADDMALMSAPFGAAGLEMTQLLVSCGCIPMDPMFDMSRLPATALAPFLFGEVKEGPEIPEWLEGVNIQSFLVDRGAIPIPLSCALMLYPETGYTCIKDGRTTGAQPPMSASQKIAEKLAEKTENGKEEEKKDPKKENPQKARAAVKLQAHLVHEANAVKGKLREACESRRNPLKFWGVVPEPAAEDSLLAIPDELFTVGFDSLGHISQLLRYVVCPEQPLNSVMQLDVLDPRLPVRISKTARGMDDRSNPIMLAMSSLASGTGLPNSLIGGKGGKEDRRRRSQPADSWGEMPFYCPLTKICTYTSSEMRDHMRGDLYRRLANNTPGWHDSVDKKDLMFDLEEADREARRRLRSPTRSPRRGRGRSRGDRYR